LKLTHVALIIPPGSAHAPQPFTLAVAVSFRLPKRHKLMISMCYG